MRAQFNKDTIIEFKSVNDLIEYAYTNIALNSSYMYKYKGYFNNNIDQTQDFLTDMCIKACNSYVKNKVYDKNYGGNKVYLVYTLKLYIQSYIKNEYNKRLNAINNETGDVMQYQRTVFIDDDIDISIGDNSFKIIKLINKE